MPAADLVERYVNTPVLQAELVNDGLIGTYLGPRDAGTGYVLAHHLAGRVLGRHAGIINFTVGQRRGLGIAAGEPLYVVRLDAAKGRVVVGPRSALRMTRILLRDLNWIGESTLDGALAAGPLDVFIKVRSARAPQAAALRRVGDAFEVELVGGEEGVAPGQACVLYDAANGQARMLGGGFIRSAAASHEREAMPPRGGEMPVPAR
jgi:tRNA-specific 2-thiouridylase